VAIAVSGSSGTPTGSIVLSSGSYTSSSTTLSSGSTTVIIPAGSLATGSDTLTAKYTPDSASSSTYNSASGTGSVTVTAPALVTPTVTVTPAASSITTAQSLSVTIAVSGSSGTPTGSIVLSSGSYTSSSTTLSSGSTTVIIPAGSLATGSDTLTAKYTPDSASSSTYNSASGTGSVTVTTPALVTPTVTVTPAASSITATQPLSVTVAVSGASGTPTGSIVLSSGSYTSSATTLSSGSATVNIAAGSLTTGTDTLTAAYTPDSSSSSKYNSASGTGSVTVTAISSSITVSVDVLANRHAISPYIYGGAYPQDAAHVTDSGTTLVRWGGNATSNYNWQLYTYNSGADYYYEDYNSGGLSPSSNGDSVQWVTDVKNAGSHPLMTMVMLPWVAQSAENGSNGHWSFSVATYGAQCSVDHWVPDAGNGLETDCSTPVTSSASTVAYYPLLDDNTETCSASTCVYRNAWAKALATAFGSGSCPVPDSNITSCHFYDMDNEIDIWGGTHRDVHPAPAGYDELANVYVTEAAKLKTWDPEAVRFGPVSCCWWYYWNGANGSDKAAHGGVDFLPWWLNQVAWQDQIAGARTLDVFDIHAYADANTSGLSTSQLKALSADIYRDYWDPTYVSTSGTVNQQWATSIQPNRTIPFRIPRMRALVNAIYPGTPLAFTEWSAAFVSESDFSTALGDTDAYGIFGRERLSFASRWGAPVPTNPNYQALKLYTNYDGAHHGFGTTSIAATETGNSSLLTSYAALDAAGTTLTVMVVNKNPSNTASVAFDLSGFNATSYTAYTLASSSSSAISASASAAWNANQTFAPYSATLLVIAGSLASTPASEWDLNPDVIMVPSSGTVTLHPQITSGSTNVTLSSALFDSYEGASACSGSIALTAPTLTPTQAGTLTVPAGSTSGFCHFTVTGSDGSVTQTQGGWIVVGNPPATLTVTSGNGQTGSHGTALSQALTVTLAPGQSGGVATGAGILFTTSAGTLSNGTTSGASVIATTNSSGVASVTLTLPSTAGTVTVQAQDQFALGGAITTFTETAQ
jgi:hypothetical protein